MTMPGDHSADAPRWSVRPRTAASAQGAPTVVQSLRDELVKIERRLEVVIHQGREAFTEGSGSYDRATVAVLRLAALFEDSSRFAPYLTVVTLDERRGIVTTRNIASHSGCGALNTEIFWRTVTERLPEVIARIRAAIDS
ncbi:antitoxin [Brachybacterium avium]|uniref:Antitoxin n=1 Tax=Brachybacterium avium TaxID=2017485 RepID=A0A220UCA3_9MICO|nr:antitoxin [Brachybacterium avium]ASK65552.1 antitoxin [Brachybacterium avium]